MGTITKALEMLSHFSRLRPEIGLTEFVRLTGRDKATVHRHLVELERNGFLEQHPATRAYRLGPAILRLSAVREATHPLRHLIRPVVKALADEVGELAHASLLQGGQLSPLYHVDPKQHRTQVHFDEAELLPLHATSSGLAILAFAPALARQVLAQPLTSFTAATPATPDSLHSLIEETRATGLARQAQAFDPEVASQAVAFFDAGGTPIGAISVSVPTARASHDKLADIQPALVAAARAATRSLGGTFPPDHPLS